MAKRGSIKNIGQCDIVCGIMTALDRLGVKDAEPRIVNVCIRAADDIYAELQRDPVAASDGMGLSRWIASDDTGLSSCFMAYVCAGAPAPLRENGKVAAHYPYDPSDFGRCYRFLRAVPEARTNLDRMKLHGSVWSAYIERWDEMERLYEEAEASGTGSAPKLYTLMQSIQKEHG